MTAPRVALVDTGVNPTHPHVAGVAGGVAIAGGAGQPLTFGDGWLDRLGHGTAVAGAVRLLAPDAQLLAVSVFDPDGRAPWDRLVAAIDWAIAEGCALCNLSVGTPDPAAAEALAAAVARATAAGMLVVAAAPLAGPPTWPAAAPGALGVRADMDLAPHAVGYVAGDPTPWRALGAPRALAGPNQRRNFKGGSFAAARVTGLLADAWTAAGVQDAARLRAWLADYAGVGDGSWRAPR